MGGKYLNLILSKFQISHNTLVLIRGGRGEKIPAGQMKTWNQPTTKPTGNVSVLETPGYTSINRQGEKSLKTFLSTSAGCCVCCLEAGLRSATTTMRQETDSRSCDGLRIKPPHSTWTLHCTTREGTVPIGLTSPPTTYLITMSVGGNNGGNIRGKPVKKYITCISSNSKRNTIKINTHTFRRIYFKEKKLSSKKREIYNVLRNIFN